MAEISSKSDVSREVLEEAFYRSIPNARKASPMWQAFFQFMYVAHQRANEGAKVLNVYASHDRSGNRETVYREKFFPQCEYHGVDYWEDKFFPENEVTSDSATLQTSDENPYHLPYPDNYFDVLINTKIVMEHVSEPERILKEFYRVLKSGGEAFIPAPHIRRQHQAPHDYFRYTEYALQYLSKKAGFEVISIDYSNGFAVTATQYAYFFQRGLEIPKVIEKIFDAFHYWIIEPLGFVLDKLDNGYGRDFTLYFLVRLKKR